MTKYNGKVIYNPSGKAGEYSEWAANFYVGCSNGCDYCYLKKGRGAKILGGNIPTLKKSLHNPYLAMYYFEEDIKANLSELQIKGIFFSFTTDPLLKETSGLTIDAIEICQFYHIPVSVLTKCCGDGLTNLLAVSDKKEWDKSIISIGFTLTGFDSKEPGAAPNSERILTLEILKKKGYKTFASIEPIIEFEISYDIIELSYKFVDLYKIGLESGKKYKYRDTRNFITCVNVLFHNRSANSKIYFKDSILKIAEWERNNLPPWCVKSDFNLFNKKI